MQDIVIGAVTNYTYHDIEPWLVSLKRTGYQGIIALVVYNMKKEDADKLVSQGVTIFSFMKDDMGNLVYYDPRGPQNFNIVVDRFAHMWYFLNQLKEPIRYVLATDVKDVIFQSDPIKSLVGFPLNMIRVASENFLYKDETWSANNMKQAFGDLMFDHMKDRPIYCAGVIAGGFEIFLDLCLSISLICSGAPKHVSGGGGPDQAAMNILLSTQPWKEKCEMTSTVNSWCVHMGTTRFAIQEGSGDAGIEYTSGRKTLEQITDNFIGPDARIYDAAGYPFVANTYDNHYVIVHQYNRVKQLNVIWDREFRE